MVNKIRFWLSFQLLLLGVRMCPDAHAQNWLKYGLKVAGTGLAEDLVSDDEDK